jgi:carbonic anhydrase
MATPVQENLQTRNASYASTFDKGDLEIPPAKKYTVGKFLTRSAPNNIFPVPIFDVEVITHCALCSKVTCMDARIDPAAAYGIDLGDAHVIRNAGGHARPALRDILISQQLLGTKEVIIVKHTGCGMLLFKNEDALGLVEKNLGDQARASLKDFDFHTITDLEQAVQDDVAWLKSSGFVAKDVPVSGWIYDVTTGKVNRVV